MIIKTEDFPKVLGYKQPQSYFDLIDLGYVIATIIKEKLGLGYDKYKISNNGIRNIKMDIDTIKDKKGNTYQVLGLTLYNLNNPINMYNNEVNNPYVLDNDDIEKILFDLGISLIHPRPCYNENEKLNNLVFTNYKLDFTKEAIKYLKTKIVYYKLMRK